MAVTTPVVGSVLVGTGSFAGQVVGLFGGGGAKVLCPRLMLAGKPQRGQSVLVRPRVDRLSCTPGISDTGKPRTRESLGLAAARFESATHKVPLA